MEVGFERSALLRVAGCGVVLLVSAVAMLVVDEWRPGRVPPTWLRIAVAAPAAALGAWFLAACVRRLRSDEPAIRVDGDGAFFHVNPGRRVLLRHDEIASVGEVEPVARGPRRFIVGDRLLTVATTRREGFWASSIVVGSRFVAEDLDAVRERLVANLAWKRGRSRLRHPAVR